MAVIDISDFRPGRNTSDDPLLIPPGACVATSQNVWAPGGPLQKIPGFTTWGTFSATGSNFSLIYADSIVASASYNLYARVTVSAVDTTQGFIVGTNAGVTWDKIGYTTGTVSISGANLISATGDGTSWLEHAAAGDFFYNGDYYRIASVEDDQHLTLSTPVGSQMATGSTYSILHTDGLTLGNPITFAGHILFGSRSQYLQLVSTAGSVRETSAPKSLNWAVFKNYAFSFANPTAESRLQWCEIRNPLSWPVNNFIDIDKDRGKGQGLIAYGNELICFKTRGMYKVIGEIFDPSNPTYSVVPISVPTDFGFMSSFSPVEHNGLLYFLGNGGVYVYKQGTTFITRVSEGISADSPILSGTINGGGVTNGTLQSFFGVSFDGNLIFSPVYKGDSTPNFALVNDRYGGWWKVQDTTATAENTILPNRPTVLQTSPSALLGIGQKCRVYKWDLLNAYKNASVAGAFITTANGASDAPIAAQWRSKQYNVEYGHFKQMVVYFAKQAAGSLTFGWSIDQGTFVTASADMTVGRGNLIRKTFDIGQKGSTFQLKILQESANTPFKVYAAKVYYDPILENRQA
jgi:hypothetical protein